MKNIISCKEYVEIQKQQLKEKVFTFERKPKLCVVQIGNDQASNVYVKNKEKVCNEVGIDFKHVHIDNCDNLSQLDLEVQLELLNLYYDGIILQLPIPDKYNVEELQKCISPEKDVDGFRPDSYFKPCTPKGIVDWLDYNNVFFDGMYVTVVGRSKIVGKPLINMLLDRNVTIACCNSHTVKYDLIDSMEKANVVISAIGKPKYFNSKNFDINTIIVDVGINRDENGKLCGDIDKEDVELLDNVYVTPVPGGVGLITVISLMKNVVEAYELQNEK